MSETKSIRVSAETHGKLKLLSEQSDRTISATAERMLKSALEIKEMVTLHDKEMAAQDQQELGQALDGRASGG